MYDGRAQQSPRPPAAPVPAPTRRGGAGRTVAITAAAVIAVYALVVGAVAAMPFTSGGGGPTGPEPGAGLPTEPCAVPSWSHLAAVSGRMPSATFGEASSSCVWYARFSDGSIGFLSLEYWLPSGAGTDEVVAEAEFGERSGDLVHGMEWDSWTMEVLESRDLDIADEALLSHLREGDGEVSNRAVVLVRAENILVTVQANESWETRTGASDFTGDEELLISVAERAVTALE